MIAKRTTAFGLKMKHQASLLILLAPAMIWYIAFNFIPLIGNLASFTNLKSVVLPWKIVGFDNFIRMYKSPDFWTAFWNTLIISFFYIVFYFPMPIILALLMNELKNRSFKRAVQTIVYIPYFFSWVVVGSIFITLLAPNRGIVNIIIGFFGGPSDTYFMASTQWFRPVLVMSYIWRQVGYGTVIYLAALSTVDLELYDAAKVDGAGYWLQLIHITLPSIRNTIVTMLLLNLSAVMRIFDQILVMQIPAVYSVSDVLRTYAFREGLDNRAIGYATAVSLLTSLLSCLLVLSMNKISKAIFDESVL
ncbi:MAG: sugar ABC transporter permease [Spirochaetales bacterium]|nr:sugar ABC transporter permease [Spirochaetales bacterium]